jgi:DNA polymerase bacteriophage-type
MQLITLDFESYWSTTHTLSRMSPTEYVMHPDTEIQSVSIKVNNNPTNVLFGEDTIRKYLQGIDWSDTLVVGHNMSGFDAMILAWRFGIMPKMYGCTAAMARSQYSKTGYNVGGKFLTGVSLKKIAAELGIGYKLDLEATNTKGKRLSDFTAQELRAMEEYNKVDTDLCYGIFKKLYPSFPKQEMLLIDMTTRMLVEPKFELAYEKVKQALEDVKAEKARGLRELYDLLYDQTEQVIRALEGGPDPEEFVRSTMASAAKFGELLQQRGIEVPMKVSPTNPNKMTPALAKTDEAFIALQDHDDPVVAAAARVRLDVKSTLLETRLQAFLTAANACDGKLPVPLKYAGADTTGRWSGEQYNMQNLPRIDTKKARPSDALRKSLLAPKGHKVVVADLSGIELRVNMFLWKVPYAMELFKASPDKADLYRYFAAHDLYNIIEDEVTKNQRQVGKVAHLGLGFGAGGATFQKVAKLMGGIDMPLDEATGVVNTYRDAHGEIVNGWRRFQDCLPHIMQGTEESIDPWGHCVTEHQAVRLPSGRRIHYPSLVRERENGKSEWWYGNGRSRARIYAGKGVENLVQALARDVIAEHAVEFYKRSKLRPALMVHDELVYVVPDSAAQDTLDELQGIMRSGVSWWPELVTWSEGDIADSYGEAK